MTSHATGGTELAQPHSQSMRAVRKSRYGDSGALELIEGDRPTPGEGQVLVRVRAASLNALDWHFLSGTPYFIRLMMGLRRPKRQGIGVDFSGVVEAVGDGVDEVRPGDRVFGAADGTCAEYAVARKELVLPLPEGIDFDAASTLNVAAVTALQGLRDEGEVGVGQTVLINGAAGGVGTFAVQIAKLHGATVTAVCSGRNVEMVRSLGADEVIDYTAEDISQMRGRFDLIFDNAGSQRPSVLAKMLTPNGRLVVVTGPKKGKLFGPLTHIIRSKARFTFGSRQMRRVDAQSKRDDLAQIADWVAAGSITPAIHRTYSLEETPQAMELIAGGHAPAKLVINP